METPIVKKPSTDQIIPGWFNAVSAAKITTSILADAQPRTGMPVEMYTLILFTASRKVNAQ